jgi:hypothetical protein
MNTRLTEDKKFKEAVGAFIIAFSELEYGLADLGSMTEFDLRKKIDYFTKHVGFPFEKKVENLTGFIDENLVELKPIWDELKVEIGQLNYERRFIAHGFIQYFLPHESSTTSTYVKKGKKLVERKHDSDSVKKLTNRIHHLNTGANGINGAFHTLFSKSRINNWNSLVNDDSKIVYKANNEIISDWKGK